MKKYIIIAWSAIIPLAGCSFYSKKNDNLFNSPYRENKKGCGGDEYPSPWWKIYKDSEKINDQMPLDYP